LKKALELTDIEWSNIIKYTKEVLDKAIVAGGTTIRSYESSEGVHGRFQQNLLVHNHVGDDCVNCKTIIEKIKVGGRGTYYCPKCQK
jgi:formamidopyrimidine-DNA glycosylase